MRFKGVASVPFVHHTPPSDLTDRTNAARANIYSHIQLPKHPVPVYVLSGSECVADVLAAATPSLWRYYDDRGLGAHVDMEATDPPEINSTTQQGEFGIAVRDRIALIEKRARLVRQSVSVRIIEIPDLGEMAIWELRDGVSHGFHTGHHPEKALKEETPEVFYERIAEASAKTAHFQKVPGM